jgi:hypothetical protein
MTKRCYIKNPTLTGFMTKEMAKQKWTSFNVREWLNVVT